MSNTKAINEGREDILMRVFEIECRPKTRPVGQYIKEEIISISAQDALMSVMKKIGFLNEADYAYLEVIEKINETTAKIAYNNNTRSFTDEYMTSRTSNVVPFDQGRAKLVRPSQQKVIQEVKEAIQALPPPTPKAEEDDYKDHDWYEVSRD